MPRHPDRGGRAGTCLAWIRPKLPLKSCLPLLPKLNTLFNNNNQKRHLYPTSIFLHLESSHLRFHSLSTAFFSLPTSFFLPPSLSCSLNLSHLSIAVPSNHNSSVAPFQNNFPIDHKPFFKLQSLNCLTWNKMPMSEPLTQTHRIRILGVKREPAFPQGPQVCSMLTKVSEPLPQPHGTPQLQTLPVNIPTASL